MHNLNDLKEVQCRQDDATSDSPLLSPASSLASKQAEPAHRPSPSNHDATLANRLSPNNQVPLPHHLERLPIDYEPGHFDVICHRGKTCDEHIGNRRFRLCVENYVQAYVRASSRQAKSEVISAVVRRIRCSMGKKGGFVIKDPNTKRWHHVDSKVARDKVGNALRDAARQYLQESRPDCLFGGFAPGGSKRTLSFHTSLPAINNSAVSVGAAPSLMKSMSSPISLSSSGRAIGSTTGIPNGTFSWMSNHPTYDFLGDPNDSFLPGPDVNDVASNPEASQDASFEEFDSGSKIEFRANEAAAARSSGDANVSFPCVSTATNSRPLKSREKYQQYLYQQNYQFLGNMHRKDSLTNQRVQSSRMLMNDGHSTGAHGVTATSALSDQGIMTDWINHNSSTFHTGCLTRASSLGFRRMSTNNQEQPHLMGGSSGDLTLYCSNAMMTETGTSTGKILVNCDDAGDTVEKLSKDIDDFLRAMKLSAQTPVGPQASTSKQTSLFKK